MDHKKTKRISGIILLNLLLLSVCIINSCCKKEKPAPPIVETYDVTEITSTTATSGGNVTNEGNSTFSIRGVCWSTSPDPTFSTLAIINPSGTGSFTCNISNLKPNTKYYLKAFYGENYSSIVYGNEVTFSTLVGSPALKTNIVYSITHTTAVSGGNISTENGGGSVISRGVCWSTSPNPTTSDSKSTDGSGSGLFTSSISGLTTGTQYYVRAYATNNSGTGYGNQVSFATMGINGGFTETFSNGTTNWKSDNTFWKIISGWYTSQNMVPLSSISYFDRTFTGSFTYQFDVQFNSNGSGMPVLISDDFLSLYSFNITSSGKWWFSKSIYGSQTTLQEPVSSPFINTPSTTNSLKIVYSYPTSIFSLYANNYFLGNVVDSTIKSGKFGVRDFSSSTIEKLSYSMFKNITLNVTSTKGSDSNLVLEN